MNRSKVRFATLVAPLLLAAAGIAVAIQFNNSDEQWVAALVGWIVGWFFLLVAVAGWEIVHGRAVFGRPDLEQPAWRRSEVITLLFVLTAAALLRVVALESYPIALHNDEMSCLLEARGFLGRDTAIFNVGWFSCPNLGFFLTSLWIRALGPTLLTLRLSSAVLGLLSLVAVYLVVRRLFGVRPAMMLLILTTPFHWHLHFSRTGFHYMQAGSLTAVTILLFVLAVDRRSPVLFGCAGVAAGIACQTYYAAWLIPLILAAWVIARLLSVRSDRKTVLGGFFITVVFMIATVAPLLVHYVERPRGATARTSGVFLFSDHNREHVAFTYGTTNPPRLLATQATHLAKLLVGGIGDSSRQYGLQDRFIDPFLLPLFLGGLVYALFLVRSPGGQLLWIWFLGTMVAGGLLTIDAPFSPRLIGVTPIILLFPVLLVDRILRIPKVSRQRWISGIAAAGFATIVVLSAWWNLRTTFVSYPTHSGIQYRDYIVRLAADLGNVRTIANFTDPEKFKHQAYRALAPKARGQNLRRTMTGIEDYARVVNALGPGTLVIAPLGDNDFYGLCDVVGGDPAGMVVTGHVTVGFEWCFVE